MPCLEQVRFQLRSIQPNENDNSDSKGYQSGQNKINLCYYSVSVGSETALKAQSLNLTCSIESAVNLDAEPRVVEHAHEVPSGLVWLRVVSRVPRTHHDLLCVHVSGRMKVIQPSVIQSGEKQFGKEKVHQRKIYEDVQSETHRKFLKS